MSSIKNPEFVTLVDQYNQPWRIDEFDPLWQEAKATVASANGQTVMWPLEKIAKNRGYGWWTTFKKIDDIEADLEKQIPNPGKQLLIDVDKEYTPTELRDLLQRFGAYLSYLNHLEGIIEAQCHALKEGLKTGIQVGMRDTDIKETVTAREGQILSKSEVLRNNRKMQIDNEAILLLVQGWRKAYESAFTTTSRLITLLIGEAQLTTERYN